MNEQSQSQPQYSEDELLLQIGRLYMSGLKVSQFVNQLQITLQNTQEELGQLKLAQKVEQEQQQQDESAAEG